VALNANTIGNGGAVMSEFFSFFYLHGELISIILLSIAVVLIAWKCGALEKRITHAEERIRRHQ
jgi:hypothetical protein